MSARRGRRGGLGGVASSYIAWYLFLAGAGSGAFVIGAFVDLTLRFKEPACLVRVSPVTDAGLVAGPALVALGSVFLVLDLGAPERAFAVFLSPVSSVLGFGAWSVAVFCLSAVGALALGVVQDTRAGRVVELVLQAVATVAALCVMGYSGVFLSLWSAVPFLNTPLVPALFTASALTTGAAVLIVAGFCRQNRPEVESALDGLAMLDLVLVVAEAAALAAFLLASAQAGDAVGASAEALMAGRFAGAFWLGVVGLGLAAPFVVDVASRRSLDPLALLVGSCCTLAGGVCLRYVLLLAAVRFNLVGMTPLPFWL